jgi:DNA-binding CsgD family transcriptional regulator
LSRARRDFSDRDTAVLNAVGPALAAFYRQMKRLEAARATLPDRLGLDGAATAALTARESEVLEWVAAGKSDAQIGAILNISPRTVGKHLQHLYEKLGVESRTAAAMRVARRRREA